MTRDADRVWYVGHVVRAADRLDHRQPAGAAPWCRPPRPRRRAGRIGRAGHAAGAAAPVDSTSACRRRSSKQAKAQPTDAAVRAELANLYFDAQRFRPGDSRGTRRRSSSIRRTSTSARISRSATTTSNDFDRALAQIDQSLAIDPRTRRRCSIRASSARSASRIWPARRVLGESGGDRAGHAGGRARPAGSRRRSSGARRRPRGAGQRGPTGRN